MKTYVLSFTEMLSDRKGYVLAFNQHKNVYNDNNYIVAFDPWSTYAGAILDDMKVASKRRYNFNRSFIKGGNVILNEDAVIDDSTVHPTTFVSTRNIENTIDYGKIVKDVKSVPSAIEKAFTKMQTQVNEYIASKFVHDGDTLRLIDTVTKALRGEADKLAISLYKEMSKHSKIEESQLGNVLMDFRGILERGLGEALLSPYTVMNDKLDLPTLLSVEGYTVDKMNSTNSLSSILVGSTITSQTQAMVAKEIYYAIVTSQMMIQMTSATAIKMYNVHRAERTVGSIYYGAKEEYSIEKASVIFTTNSKEMYGEVGKVFFDTGSSKEEVEFGRMCRSDVSHITNEIERSTLTKVMTGAVDEYGDKSIPLVVNSSFIYTDIEKSRSSNHELSIIDDVSIKSSAISTNQAVTDDVMDKSKSINTKMTVTDDVMDMSKIVNTDLAITDDVMDKSVFVLSDTAIIDDVSDRGNIIGSQTSVIDDTIDKSVFVISKNTIIDDSMDKSKLIAGNSSNPSVIDDVMDMSKNVNSQVTGIDDVGDKGKLITSRDSTIDDSMDTNVLVYNNKTVTDDVMVTSKLITDKESVISSTVGNSTLINRKDSVIDFTDKSVLINLMTARTASKMDSYKLFNSFKADNPDKLSTFEALDYYSSILTGSEVTDDSTNVYNAINDSLDIDEGRVTYGGYTINKTDVADALDVYDGFTPNEIIEYVSSGLYGFKIDTQVTASSVYNFNSVNDKLDIGDAGEPVKLTDLVFITTPNDDYNVKDTDVHFSDVAHRDVEIQTELQRISYVDTDANTEDVQLTKIDSSINNKLFDIVLDNVVSTMTGSEKDVSLELTIDASHSQSGNEVYLDTVQESSITDKGNDIQLDVVESGLSGDTKDVFLHVVGTSSSTDTDIDTLLETAVAMAYSTNYQESILKTIEQAVHNELDNIVYYEQLEESTLSTESKDTTLDKQEIVSYSEGERPVFYETFTAYNGVEGITETAIEEVTQFGWVERQEQTEIMGQDLAGHEAEYEAQDSKPMYGTTSTEYEAYGGKDEVADKRTTGSIYISQEETDREGLPKGREAYLSDEEHSVKGITQGITINSGEMSNHSVEVESYDSSDETATKKVTQGIYIGSDEMSDYGTSQEAFSGHDVEGQKKITTSMDTPRELESMELGLGREATSDAVELAGNKITNSLTITERPGDVDSTIEYSADETKTSSTSRLDILRGYTSKDISGEGSDVEAILPNNDSIGEGKPLPPHPADPKVGKKKIWSVMGKQYPAWNNWNPKKTR